MKSFKIISIALIVISMIMMLFGWVEFREIETIDYIFFDQLSDLDVIENEYSDELKEMGDELKSIGINVSPLEMVKSLTNITHMIKDGSISPYEVATRFNKFIKVSKKISKLTDEQRQYIPADLLNMGEDMNDVYLFVGMYKLLFWLTVAVNIIYIVLRVLNKRNLGIPLIVLQFLWIVGTMFIVGAINDIEGNIVKLTFAPFVSIICIIAAVILWAIKRPAKIVKNK